MKNAKLKMALGLLTLIVSVNGMASITTETLENVRTMIHIDKVTTAKTCNQEMIVQKDNLYEEIRTFLGDQNVTSKIQLTCVTEMTAYLKNYCASKLTLFSDAEKLMTDEKVQAVRTNLGMGADDRAVGEVINFKIQRSMDAAKKRWSGYVQNFANVAKCPIVKKDKKDFENEMHMLTDFVKQRLQDTLITASPSVK